MVQQLQFIFVLNIISRSASVFAYHQGGEGSAD